MHEPARRRLVLLLSVSVALMMSGYGIVVPVFAKRVREMNEGVDLLGIMAMAFGVGQLLAAPVMGALADRHGRRPVILLSLAGLTVAEAAFLAAQTSLSLICIQFANGVVTAGLLPASMGLIADLFSEDKRARWTGVVMSSYGAGFTLGPAIGGVVCDRWGLKAPFMLSAGIGLTAFLFAAHALPETRDPRSRSEAPRSSGARRRFWSGVLPTPVGCVLAMLALDFLVVFAFALVEPVLMFHAYDALGFTATQLGILVGGYGLSMASAQIALGGSSDSMGRRPVIAVGFVLNAALYVGLIAVSNFWAVLTVAALGGIGSGLISPALGAAYLDLAAEEDRSRIVGMKEAASSFGCVVGPLTIAVLGHLVRPHDVFAVGAASTLFAAALAVLVLHGPPRRLIS